MRPRLTSGTSALDAVLGGGWPQGKVGELIGPASSGRSGVATSTVAAAGARGEVAAWLDPTDAFDPASAAAAGVDLARLLWVRPRGVEEAVRAAELVLEVGGFTVLVLDLGSAAHGTNRLSSEERGAGGGRPPLQRRRGAGSAPYEDMDDRFDAGAALAAARSCDDGGNDRARTVRRRGRGALRLRLARAVERAGAVALVLAERPWAGTLAGVTVAFGRGEERWGECGGQRWLAGISLRVRVERGRVGDAAPNREADAVAQTAPSATPVILRSDADGAATKDPTDVAPPTASLARPWDPSRAARAQDDGGVGPPSEAALGA